MFEYGMRTRSSFTFFRTGNQLPQCIYCKDYPSPLNYLGTFVEMDPLHVGLFLDTEFCFTDMSLLMPTTHCLDFCGLILSLKIRSVKSSTLLLLFHIILAILGLLNFHIHFRTSLSIRMRKPVDLRLH